LRLLLSSVVENHAMAKSLLALFCAFFFCSIWGADAPGPDPKWEKEITALEMADRANPVTQPILFVGSSSIRLWKNLSNDFPNLKVVNHGFGGSKIADSTAYADRIIVPLKPSKIVLYAGDNDVAAGNSPEQVLADFKGFVEKMRASLGDTPIYYISIKPSPSRWQLAGKAMAANRMIKEFAATRDNVTFINVWDSMLGSNGEPDPSLFIGDNLHMNEKGYAVWKRIISEAIEKKTDRPK
jgi:lysophospholipase L1-like esterase